MTAEPASPDAVLKMYYSAMNAGKADAASALFAADAIRREQSMSTPEQVVIGLERIEAGIRARVDDHIEIEAEGFRVDGNKVTCTARVSTDYGRRMGYAPVEEAVEVMVANGKIAEFTVSVSPDSCARMNAAERRADVVKRAHDRG